MTLKGLLLTVGALALIGIGFGSSAKADQWDKKTTLTVKRAIQVPNLVLNPGTYVLKLASSASNRHIVQIFNANETEVLTTVLAIPNYRLTPTGNVRFSFWEMPPGQPRALRAWFYPGDNFGQEFAYPKAKAVAIAAVTHTEVPSTEAKAKPELEKAPVAQVTPEGVEKPLPEEKVEFAKALPPPVPTPVEKPAELPKTASPYPWIGLAGVVFLVAFAVFRLARKS